MACGGSLALLLLGLAPAATAGSDSLDSTLAAEDPVRAAAQAYSADNDVELSSAIEAVQDQGLVIEAVNDLDVELGVDADVWVDQDGAEQHVVVRTEQDRLARAINQLDLSPGTTVTVLDEPPISEQGIALTDEVERVVRDQSPNVQGLYVRPSDGALVVETSDDPAGLSAGEIASASGFPAVIIEQVEEASDSILVRGGVALGGCTAGFSAKYGSYIGYFSAAHCGASQKTFSNTAGTGTSVTGTRRVQNYGVNADIAFYSIPSGNTLSRTFFGSSSTSATSVGGPQDVPVGASVCHRGKTKGWKCGKITSISYKPTWSGACPGGSCNSVFVRVSAEQAGGDSGGPWVNGTSPIGIHKGGAATWSVYSKISRIPSGSSLY